MMKEQTLIDNILGKKLRTFRLERGLSQNALAVQVGISFQQIQKYEKGSSRVTASRLALIADCLDIPVSAFFDSPTGVSRSKNPDLIEIENIDSRGNLSEVIRLYCQLPLRSRKDVLNILKAMAASQKS